MKNSKTAYMPGYRRPRLSKRSAEHLPDSAPPCPYNFPAAQKDSPVRQVIACKDLIFMSRSHPSEVHVPKESYSDSVYYQPHHEPHHILPVKIPASYMLMDSSIQSNPHPKHPILHWRSSMTRSIDPNLLPTN